MQIQRWESIRVNREELDVAVVAETGQWNVVADLDTEDDTTLYFRKNESIVETLPLEEPRSVDLATDGTAIVADWIEFGTNTEAKLHLFNPAEGNHQTTTVSMSSPLVAISESADHFVVTGYSQIVRIYDGDSMSMIKSHTALYGERLVPLFDQMTQDIILSHEDPQEANLYYRIDTRGSIVYTTDGVEKLQYAQSFDLDKDSDWVSVIPELTGLYEQTTNEYAKQVIANVIGDASLAYLKDKSMLNTVIDTVSSAHGVFSDEHQKLSAKILSDAHYRLGKVRASEGYSSDAHEQWRVAQDYANTVLPWYDGKKMLSKIHRKRARNHKKQNRYTKAASHVERIFELENEYDVQLTKDADKRLYEQVS